MLKPGPDTAAAVLQAFKDNPQSHNQLEWVQLNAPPNFCGTTRCAAGETLHQHGYADSWIMHVGMMTATTATQLSPLAAKAAGLLEISDADARLLFHYTTNKEAVEALEWIAAGKKLNWDEILGRVSQLWARDQGLVGD